MSMCMFHSEGVVQNKSIADQAPRMGSCIVLTSGGRRRIVRRRSRHLQQQRPSSRRTTTGACRTPTEETLYW